jgi:hypothetical protein
LIPSVASTAWVRGIVVNKINQDLNGHVQVADWSLGWTSGIRVDGVKVFDGQNRQILEVPHISTQLSLLNAVRGNYNIGQTVIDGLDFDAIRYADGSLNFQRLQKQSPPAAGTDSSTNTSASKAHPETEKKADEQKVRPERATKLPNVRGELKLVNCRGTVETIAIDPASHQEHHDMVKFTSIQGDVKIPDVNQTISDSLQVAETAGNSSGPAGKLDVNGQILLGQKGYLLPLDKMSGKQTVALSAIELAGLAPMAPSSITSLAGNTTGTVSLTLSPGQADVLEGQITSTNLKLGGPIVSGNTYTAQSATLTLPKSTATFSGGGSQPSAGNNAQPTTIALNNAAVAIRDIVLHKPDGDANVGNLDLGAKGLAISMGPAATKQPATTDQVRELQVDQLAAAISGARLTITGSILDPASTRRFQNMGADLNYDASKLWSLILPMLSKKDQAYFKDAQVAGTYTKHIAVDGSYPANDLNAIAHLVVGGDFTLDQFSGSGATLTQLDVPFTLNDGIFTIAVPGKPKGHDLPAPATLNGGTFDLGGISADLKDPHLRVAAPAGKKLLNNVSLNPAFAQLFGDWINNPMFVTANQAAGQLDITINQCTRFPLDDTVLENSPANDGILDLAIALNKVQLGNQTLSKISQQVSAVGVLGGNTPSIQSLQGDIPKLHVHIEHGITTEEMTMTFGQGQRPLNLNGTVTMATKQMNMTLDLPWHALGIQNAKQASFLSGNGLVIPLTGTISNPQFDAAKVVQENFAKQPQDLLKGLLGGKNANQSSSSQPSDDNNPINQLQDLLGGKKKKKK